MTELMQRRRALMGAKKTDPYTWAELFKSIDAGTYSTKYALGDLIPLDLGTGGTINMQIVAFDKDTVADSTNKAPVTLISKELYKTSHRYNPAYVSGEVGTGTIGGWPNCELRTYLHDTVFPLIPASVSQRILTVSKLSVGYNVSDTKVNNMASSDKLWIPRSAEISATGSPATLYPYYSDAWSSTASPKRQKAKAGGNNAPWFLRDAYSTTGNFNVTAKGVANDTGGVSNVYGFPICFCVG